MISEVDIKDFQDYQDKAWETAMSSARTSSYLFNGLAGESGEVCSLFAKAVRDGISDHKEFNDKLKKELGDVLWFVATLAKHSGLSLQEVAEANIAKLQDRMRRNVLGGSGDDR